MRWDHFRRSSNVEDARGRGGFGGGFRRMPAGGGRLGIGAIIVIALIGWALGIDPRLLIGGADIINSGGSQYQQDEPVRREAGPPQDQMGDFVAAVLGNTEDTWAAIFQAGRGQYRPPRLRLYSGLVQSACGFAQSATGPFYCPSDQRIYLDTSFFREMRDRFRGCTGKACEFSNAYVIAHEVGHHVQNLLNILPKAREAQEASGSRAAANQIQVRVELQADCFAGIWAHHSDQRWNTLEPGDVEAALQTAAAIGDDRLQRQTQGQVVPDAFTHGSSKQRQRWFTIGLKEGTLAACDTFSAASL
jgi:predicted metalloprotease